MLFTVYFLLLTSYSLLRINAAIGAVPEAGLGHAAHAVYDARLAYARDHLASREAWLECDIRSSVVAVGVETDTVLRTFFGIVRPESEKLCIARNGGCSVGIDHAAHAAVHAAFHDDDAAGDADAAIAVYAVRVACAHVNVVVTARDLEIPGATAHASACSAPAAATCVACGGRACAASRIPAVVCGDDARDAAFKVHVRGFHAFVCDGHAHVGVVLDIECFFGVNTVVVCSDGHCAAAECDGAAAMETVIAAVDVDDATANGDARIALDALHAFGCGAGASAHAAWESTAAEPAATSAAAGCGGVTKAAMSAASYDLNRRFFGFAIRDDNGVCCRDAVKCGRYGDCAARDFYGTLAGCQICCVFGIALDAVAFGCGDVDCTAADFDGAFTLEAVVLGVHGDEAVFHLQVVAGMDTVVVVRLDDKRSFAFDGEVVLGVNACACRIGLGFAGVVGVGVSLCSRRCVRERVGRAVLGDNECLACLLNVDWGVYRVCQREALHVQVNGGVRLSGVHENLGVASAVGAAEVVFATALDGDGTACNGDAVASVCDCGATCSVGDDGAISWVFVNLFGLCAGRALRGRSARVGYGRTACAVAVAACGGCFRAARRNICGTAWS